MDRGEVAASGVRRIYQMTLDGFGTEQIAAALEQDSILTPMSYWQTRGVNRPDKHKYCLQACLNALIQEVAVLTKSDPS